MNILYITINNNIFFTNYLHYIYSFKERFQNLLFILDLYSYSHFILNYINLTIELDYLDIHIMDFSFTMY